MKKFKILELKTLKLEKNWIEKMEEIKQEINDLHKLKIEIKNNFNEEVQKVENKFNDILNSFNENKNEYLKIKNRFIDLIEFIKDVRFRKNLVDFEGIK